MNWRKIFVMLLGCLLLVCGIRSLVTPLSTFFAMGYVIGVLIFCDAIANIVAWFDAKKYVDVSGWYLVSAIISAIFGVIVMVNGAMQFAVDMALVYIVCAWIIVLAIARISLAIRIKKVNNVLPDGFKNSRWIGLIIIAILMIAFAVICMARPGIMSVLIGVTVSWVMILNGISLITIGSYIPNIQKQ